MEDNIADIISLGEALTRLPKPAAGIDFKLYAALADPMIFESFEAFERTQAAWLDAERQLAELTINAGELGNKKAELQAVLSLADEVGFGDKALRDLAAEAVALSEEADLVERTILFGQRLAAAFEIDTPMTVGVMRKLLAASKHSAFLSQDLMLLRHPGLSDVTAESVLAEAQTRALQLRSKVVPIAERLSFELEGRVDEWGRHVEVLQSARFPSIIWRRDVRKAIRRYREIERVPGKRKRLEMAADFQVLAECVEVAASFAADVRLQTICGLHFRGHETPFSQLRAVNSYIVTIKRTFSADEDIEKRLRQMLLEGPPEALARIALLSENVEATVAAQTLDKVNNDRIDLVDRHLVLTNRASKAADLGRRALALGLRPDFQISALPFVARALKAKLEAEAAVNANRKARDLMGSRWRAAESDRTLVVNVLDAAREVERAVLPKALRKYLYDRERDPRIAWLKALQPDLSDALNAVLEGWEAAKKQGRMSEVAFFGSPFANTSAATAANRLNVALESPDQLSVWINWLASYRDCAENGLGGLIESFSGQPLEGLRLSAALDRVFWRTLARDALAEYPALSRFRGLQLDKARERFRRLDEEIIQMQRGALAADLCRRPIEPGYRGVYRKEDTGLDLIFHEISKKKRHIPLRELLDRGGRSIQQAKPCFMMSPLSVAQFLKPNRIDFDLVVIDEASQMRPEESLGAVARGRQLVVVGDPMQLPPTSFFDRVDRALEDDIDDEEIVDSESILDLALAEFRPARSLRWHYRSRHESLIAFSNREFYNDLIVFPSPLDPDRDKRAPKLGVYHHFTRGKYKGRVNIEEAQKVAEAVVAFMAAEPDKSLGVVTLNQAQRDLLLEEIERLVPRERSAQAYVERWDDSLEPFFVKNLENVQGDERDVIFISTVYGPDATTGVVMNRFGPINGRYGHRRLNVLFTRAKDRVEVFTSMRPSDIKAEEGSQLGVHALKGYLEYAETGRLEVGTSTGREPDSEFEELVRDRLRENGFDVVSQVGVAGYFIDLAVKHPNRSGYLLGIECDGASYHSSRSARDRDRLRQQVLERLQWNIYRIWSTDWFQNPREELQRLLRHLERLLGEEL